MKDIYLVFGFCLAVGLQILRIIEGQRRAPQRTEVEDPLFDDLKCTRTPTLAVVSGRAAIRPEMPLGHLRQNT